VPRIPTVFSIPATNASTNQPNFSTLLEVTTDATILDSSSAPDDPSTAVVVLSKGPATASDAAIAAAVGRARRRLIAVLPVFDPSGPQFGQQVPSALHPINGFPWSPGDPARSLAACLLRLVGLAESDRRVFLSYRRTDGTQLANQLRYALADAGWDVFLDKFSVPPGVDFQQRLDRELADKAFVLLLETPDATGSPWVEHEVAFALRRRLGLMSLALPDTPAHALYGSIDPAFRRQLGTSDVVGPSGDRALGSGALDDLLEEIDQRHASAFAFRREALMYESSDEMTALGYRVEPIGQWTLLAEMGSNREVVLNTARAPEPVDLREIDLLRRQFKRPGTATRGWIVHPTEDIDDDRSSLLAWLCARRLIWPSPVMLLAGRMAP
jgi:hypothetical protein